MKIKERMNKFNLGTAIWPSHALSLSEQESMPGDSSKVLQNTLFEGFLIRVLS